MSIGLDRHELQHSFESQLSLLKPKQADPEAIARAYAEAMLAVIEANNQKIESQLKSKKVGV
jgi:hypothetical protein